MPQRQELKKILGKELQKNCIMVVDDEKNDLRAINRIFANSDYAMEFVQSGGEALERVPHFVPDLVLLDVMMPGMNGYEVCRRLKSDSKTSGIMVVLVSAKNTLEDRLKGYEVEADDYITKPYDPEELRARVRILLRLKNTQDELRTVNQNLEKLVEARTRELVKKERQAIIGQMVQGIIHNLRGPIMVVRARAEFAKRDATELLEVSKEDSDVLLKSVERVTHNLDCLQDAVNKIELLIRNLLLKGSREAVGENQRFNLNDLIAQELEFLDADMDIKHGIKKNLNFDPSVPHIYGIYSDFSQLIYNLTKNAADSMRNSTKKELTITTRHDDRNIYIVFQDTGTGISSNDLQRIFDPFFTTKPIEGSEKRGDPTGTGLGLYTCSQLMKSYGAEISGQSKSGAGATFTVTMPKQSEKTHPFP